MNFKTTLTLIVVLAIVAGYFFFFELDSKTTYELEQENQTSRTEEGRALFAEDKLDAGQVTRIKIQRGPETLVLEREDGEWFQTEPVRVALNNWSARQFADDAAALRYIDQFQPGQDNKPSLSDAALDPPKAILQMEANEVIHTLRLGRRILGGHAFVIGADDQKVYVVNDALHRLVLDAKPTEWREKSIDVPEAARLDQVMFKRGEVLIELSKTEGRWFLDLLGRQRADREAVEELVEAVDSIYVDEFVADAPEDLNLYGLNDPAVMLSLRQPVPAEGEADEQPDAQPQPDEPAQEPAKVATTQPTEPPKRFTLRIGSMDLKQESFFATWSIGDEPSPVVFTVSKISIDKFSKTADDLRDARIVLAKTSDVREVKIERAEGEHITLQRVADQWSFGGPVETSPSYDADHQAVSDLVDALTSARADGYSSDLPQDSNASAIVTLYITGRTEPERILIFEPAESDDDTAWRILRDGESIAARLPDSKLERLFAPILSLRNKTILDLRPTQISQVTLMRDDGVVFTFTPEAPATQPSDTDAAPEPVWKLRGHDKFETEAFDDLLQDLKSLRVERWIEESVEPRPGWVEFALDLSDSSPIVLIIDPQTRRGILTHTDMSFVVPRSFVNRLTAEYRDRTVLPLTSDDIESITVLRDGTRITLRRDQDDQFVSDSADPINEEAAAGIFDTLPGLQVDRYLQQDTTTDPTMLDFTITTKDGQTFELAIDALPDEPGGTGKLRGDPATSFKLTGDTLEKLQAPLIKEEEPLDATK